MSLHLSLHLGLLQGLLVLHSVALLLLLAQLHHLALVRLMLLGLEGEGKDAAAREEVRGQANGGRQLPANGVLQCLLAILQYAQKLHKNLARPLLLQRVKATESQ